MSPSLSFHDLAEDPDGAMARIASHADGIVISYEGDDVARITPLSIEERAWRRTLVAEGEDPDAPEHAMDTTREESERHAVGSVPREDRHNTAYSI